MKLPPTVTPAWCCCAASWISQRQRLRRIIDDAVVSTGSGNDFGKDGCFFDTDVATRVRDFKRFILSGPGPEISAALLDSEKVNFFGDQIFVKEPGARERTAFRQDATHLEIDGHRCCVLWIPADPVTMENGGMMYWRGSHKSGTVYQPNVSGSQHRARAPRARCCPTSKVTWPTTTSCISTSSRAT